LSVSVLLALGISRPVQLLRQAADRVAGGDYNHPVLIRGRDEFSLLGLAFNRMLDGLREKERMHRDLMLAEEVQRNLLPARIPAGEHFDIAAAGVHCSETGGDYYDFFPGEQTGDGQFHVVVGDVSEHGIAAALLMATARAFLRSRVRQPGALDRIVSDVNRSLCADVGDSGRFMTLFHLAVDSVDRKLEWVRAGHDPALLYDPATDAFEELGGEGLALGVDPLYRYRRYAKQHIASGQIAVIGTDGIWEACNEAGEMFGKERMRRQVRVAAAQEAGMLLNGILRELKDFRGRRELEDDVTLVVVKFK
jgi:sigma-B regulation protein RsbU (phosphoserine phosphatase)